mgnify:CR=1 FL=1
MLAPDTLVEKMNSVFSLKAVLTGTRLKIFDPIRNAHKTAAEVASDLGLDKRSVEIILKVAASMDLLSVKDGIYGDLSPAIDSSHAQNVNSMLEHIDNLWGQLGDLPEIVKTGKSHLPTGHFFSSPEENRSFIRAMHSTALHNAPILAKNFPKLERKAKFLDIGAGPGTYSALLCTEQANVEATLFDMESTLKTTKEIIEEFYPDVANRIHLFGGDFYKDLFPENFDGALISHIVHSHSYEENLMLLKKAYQALRPGGVLWIHDFIPDETGTTPPFPAAFAVRMLVTTRGGNSYTHKELETWCKEVGFQSAVWKNLGQPRGLSIIEARK